MHLALSQHSSRPALGSNSVASQDQSSPQPSALRPRAAFLSLPALLGKGCYNGLPLAVLDEAVFFFPAVARRW